MLKKIGKYYWIDTYIDGKRIRRSLKTSDKLQALDYCNDLRQRLVTESKKGEVTLDDFCKKYIDFAWIDKPRSATQREFYDICMIGIHTGMRKSEILNMCWVDVKNGMIHVTGKGEKERDVPINETVQKILENKPRRYKYVIDIPNREAQDAIRKSVERVRKEVEFYWSFHQLRHYFATKMLEKGVDLVTIAKILGHSKPSISLDMYGHTSREKLLEAVGRLD